MGFTAIYLVGADCSYSNDNKHITPDSYPDKLETIQPWGSLQKGQSSGLIWSNIRPDCFVTTIDILFINGIEHFSFFGRKFLRIWASGSAIDRTYMKSASLKQWI